MAKFDFNIKYRPQIESGEYKVETRDGKPARIICWDRLSEDGDSIVALINDGTNELNYFYKNTGRFLTSREDTLDLFIITPEPELTEFEKEVASWLETAKDEPITNEMIVDAADNLMFCARQQIIRGAELSEEDEYRIRQIERIAQQAGCTQKLQEEIHDWLKALRPQPHWKPSEEQMEALEKVIKCELCAGLHTRAGILQTLYDDLQKNYSYEQVH